MFVLVVSFLVGIGALLGTWGAVRTVERPLGEQVGDWIETAADSWVAAVLAAVVGLATGYAVGSQTLLLALPGVGLCVWHERRRRRRDRARRAFDRQLPAVVDSMIQQLQSGSSLFTVCETLDSTVSNGTEVDLLEPIRTGLEAGQPLAVAVHNLAAVDGGDSAVPDPKLNLLATTLAVLASRGGPAVPALRRLRLTLIGFVHAGDEAASLASQSLASASLLAIAPAVFAITIAVADDTSANLYLHESLGTACVIGSLTASYGGWRWMNAIVQRSLSIGVIE